jgi:hypothetical protein
MSRDVDIACATPRRLSWECTLLMAALIVMFHCGCQMSAIMLDGARHFPETPRFSVTPRDYTEAMLADYGLRTDGVYVDTGVVSEERNDPGTICGYTYYRFWANGRVIFNAPGVGPLNERDVMAFDSLWHASIGYYELMGEGRVKVELFLTSGMGYVYGSMILKIDGETLWIQPGAQRRFHPLEHLTDRLGYRFIEVHGMQTYPDW